MNCMQYQNITLTKIPYRPANTRFFNFYNQLFVKAIFVFYKTLGITSVKIFTFLFFLYIPLNFIAHLFKNNFPNDHETHTYASSFKVHKHDCLFHFILVDSIHITILKILLFVPPICQNLSDYMNDTYKFFY